MIALATPAPIPPPRRAPAIALATLALSLRLTILGKSPSWPDRDGASTGYLVEVAGRTLLIDCGSGVFAKLRARRDYREIDAVIITHLHADHTLDLVPYAYALTVGPAPGSARPLLYAPPGARAAWRRLCSAWGADRLIEEAFELHEYDPGAELDLDGVRVRFLPVPHYVATYALELRFGEPERRFVFSADCGPNDELVRFAQDAALLLIEATLPPDHLEEGDEPPGHLTAAQAGTLARRARAARVVITHFSDDLDADVLREAAQTAFGGPVELAAEGATYEI